VMVTGGHLTPDGPAMWESQFTLDELCVVVDEARRHGLPVAAHAHGTEGIADAVAASVDTIEHCTWLGAGIFDVRQDVVEQIIAKGIRVSPAISRNWRGFPTRFGAEFSEQLLARLRWLDEQGFAWSPAPTRACPAPCSTTSWAAWRRSSTPASPAGGSSSWRPSTPPTGSASATRWAG